MNRLLLRDALRHDTTPQPASKPACSPAYAIHLALRACLCALALCACTLGGCHVFSGGSSGKPTLASPVTGSRFSPNLPTRVFAPAAAGLADCYLTDLPPELLRTGGDLGSAQGTIVHLHFFAKPKAGKTPIAPGATNGVLRVYVLANGSVGMYGGGGFFNDSGNPTKESFGASTLGATVYLTRATKGFEDALGPSDFAGSFSATHDEATCRALARAIDAIEGAMVDVN